MTPKKKNPYPQREFSKTVFKTDQYWFVHYTHVYEQRGPDNTLWDRSKERDFKVIIKAKSSKEAKEVLLRKIQEDNPDHSITCVKAYKLHKEYRIGKSSKKGPSAEEWDAFCQAAYPNETDTLFPFESPGRKEGCNRFGRKYAELSSQVIGQGFKKGNSNWSRRNPPKEEDKPPLNVRHLYKCIGGRIWEKIPEIERTEAKLEIIEVLKKAKGNRTAAAALLGIHKSTFLSRLKKYPEINWNKEYPIGGRPPRSKEHSAKILEGWYRHVEKFGHWNSGKKLSKETIKKRTATVKANRAKYLAKMKGKIIKALKDSKGNRPIAASLLNISNCNLGVLMKAIPDVDWNSKVKTNYSRHSDGKFK